MGNSIELGIFISGLADLAFSKELADQNPQLWPEDHHSGLRKGTRQQPLAQCYQYLRNHISRVNPGDI